MYRLSTIFFLCLMGGTDYVGASDTSICNEGDERCMGLVSGSCKSEDPVERFGCAVSLLDINNVQAKNLIGEILDGVKNIDDECIVKSELVYNQYRLSRISDYGINIDYVESLANEGYVGAIKVLMESESYALESRSNMISSLYWSLVFYSNYNQKVIDFDVNKEKRELLYTFLEGEDVGEVVEKFLSETPSLKDC